MPDIRDTAQSMANEYQETVILVEEPPAMAVSGFKSAIPYCVLVTHASPEELRAGEEIQPRVKK